MRWVAVFIAPVVVALVGCNFHSNATAQDGGADARSIDAPVDGAGSGVRGSRAMTVNLGNASELDNFTLEVVLDGSIVDYAQVTQPAGLRFLDKNGDKLAYELEHWDSGGASIAWVRVPALAGGGATQLTLQWGAGLDASHAPGVWSPNYQQVLHFDTSGSTTTDSAGNFYPPTETGVTTMAGGKIGNAAAFVVGSGVAFASGTELYSMWSKLTLQFWIYPDYASLTPSQLVVMDRGGPFSNGVLFDTGSDAGPDPEFAATWQFENGNQTTLAVPVTLQQWNHIAYTFDGNTLTAYSNGVQQPSATISAGEPTITQSDGTLSFHLGSGFTGSLDELEVQSTTAQSADWINAEIAATGSGAITYQ